MNGWVERSIVDSVVMLDVAMCGEFLCVCVKYWANECTSLIKLARETSTSYFLKMMNCFQPLRRYR